jgi:hypothetical protein
MEPKAPVRAEALKVQLRARLLSAELPLRPLFAPVAVPRLAEVAEVVAARPLLVAAVAAVSLEAAMLAAAVPAARCPRYSDWFPLVR